MNRFVPALMFLAASTGVALPNDTSAELAAGGLVFVRNDAVQMVREDLYISPERVQVDYVFENHSGEDVSTIVAFPMPDIEYFLEGEISIPHWDQENFMGFTVSVNGQKIEPSLQRRATLAGVDMTRELVKRGVSPLNFQARDNLSEADPDMLRELEALGLVYLSRYDDGSGERVWADPLWTLEMVYYWPMTFPLNEQVRVRHTYSPSVGATAGLGFNPYADLDDDWSRSYVERYCVDEPVINALRAKLDRGEMMWESWVSYILKTAQNWYRPIETFHLTVDKGRVENLVSWCGTGITKTGPTTFEVTINDFVPTRDLDILFFQHIDAN